MNDSLLKETPHRRFNPLTREWVLVSPQRATRPWQGQVEKIASEHLPSYDPNCYLCPGNSRAGGVRNPTYTSTFVFDNDFAALLPNVPECGLDEQGLLVAHSEPGLCRVMCFSPRHDLTLPRLSAEEISQVVEAWIEQYHDLASIPWTRYIQIFENRGALMGASNPHPHCQIWANAQLPNLPAREQMAQREYQNQLGLCLLCHYLELETGHCERMVCMNEGFAAIVPFWALWPFEVLLVSRRHVSSMADLNDDEKLQLGDILRRITTRYDNLFEAPFPYSMGFHQAPMNGDRHPEWHFHAHYFPPLLRSATIQKFMVGYEMLATPQRDITPEAAAARLKQVDEVHYTSRTEQKK
jgi:UDPglucose--hexose-1-phosphate uridylyltransferase